MGIKKMFMKKDPTEDEIREELNRVGISTKSNNRREEKFGAFKNYAQERQQMKQNLGPVTNPYQNMGMNQNQNGSVNPYSHENSENNPYASSGNTNTTSSPYSSSTKVSSPYASVNDTRSTSSNPYSTARPVPNASQRAPQRTKPDPYSKISRNNQDDEESIDLNKIPTNLTFSNTKPIKRQQYNQTELDLNEEAGEDDDLNLEIPEEQEQVNSEDEEVEAIKQDIRFVKKESVQSTRNTLRMAQEADASGINTLGMLGSQSERLYNAEQNLLLADTQTQIADEKVKELKRLNRSIFVPAYGNPFNKKSRLRAQEEKIKNQKMQEKYLREEHRKGAYASEQRVKQGITEGQSELQEKYRDAKNLKLSERYRFEGDSEDEDMEVEIANNLHEIGKFSSKLNQKAKAINTEVDQQNIRLRQIEEDADKLDINVHMNSTRLSNIR